MKINNTFLINNKNRIIFCSILVFSFFLLFFGVSKRTFWMDETAAIGFLGHSVKNFFINYFSFPVPENHPPLYYFLVLVINKLFYSSELFIRLPSILSGLGTICVVYYFSLLIFNDKKYAHLAMLLTACSSYFILVSQMARYHSLASFITITALYFFCKINWEVADKKDYYLLIIFYILLGWVDFPHFFYFVSITNGYFFYKFFRKLPVNFSLAKWIKIQFTVLLSFLPLLWMMYNRIVLQSDGGFGEKNLLGNGLKNFIAGSMMYVYDFFFGENTFPWDWIVFIPGIVVLAIFLFTIIKRIKFLNSREKMICFLFISAVVFGTIFMSFADARYNFIVYPKYGYVAYPLWILVCTTLLKQLSKNLRIFCISIMSLVSFYGLYNFYQSKNYINPSYFRTFESFQYVENHSEYGDYLAITPDASQGVYDFYQATYFKKLKPLGWNGFQSSTIPTSTRVWFFSTSADGSEESVATESKIPVGYTIISQFDSVPLDPKFKMLKEKFLNRPSYTYKYTVFLLKKI